ncbi:hypothetical protein CFC21_104192 [Triticum aestivum]|uniref:Uncharacterized protein n=3 Tax=Triticum TaxID=4564 RepID=A0A9R1C3C9_TRITD|nr:uncharacterized protein LOC119338432 [Triticum dicoccoides]XP_044430536.1 uncharacterized protein LOC123156471 [Triticum aestivum]KAF7103170.1 hypothetical protein CFC21_104192 [Triticum aestivum]VAI90752.1 unnamed protein product [Triticum turgidum subsp. durum]
MALRSALRKMPALGRSLGMAPRTGLVHALSLSLSPPACSRLMSHVPQPQEEELFYSDEARAKRREEFNRTEASFEQSMKDIQKDLDFLKELHSREWPDPEENFRKELRKFEKKCDIALLVLVPTTAVLFMSIPYYL